MLNEAVSILTHSPGSLVYHLNLVMTLALLLALSRIHHSRSRNPSSVRWTLAAGWTLLIRLSMMLGAGFAWLGFFEGSLILPPLDRFIGIAGALLFAWAFLLPVPHSRGNMGLISLLTLAGLASIVNIILIGVSGTETSFNEGLYDAVWGIAGLLVAITVSVLLATRRPPEWNIAAAGFALLAMGYLLHLTLGPKQNSFAGFLRWVELAAYPVFALAAVRSLSFDATHPSVTQERAITHEAPEDFASHLEVLKNIVHMVNIKEANELASISVRSLGRIMKAEYSMLLTPPDPSGQFSIAVGYDLIRETHLPGIPLSQEECPVISSALTQQRTLNLPSASRTPDLKHLQNSLRLESTGPALLVPLISSGDLHGGILLLSPFARRRWENSEQEAVEVFSEHLALRFRQLFHATILAAAESIPDESSLSVAHSRIRELEAEKETLIEQLNDASRSQVSEPVESIDTVRQAEEVASLLEMHEESKGTISALEAEIERLKSSVAEEATDTSEKDIEITRLKDALSMAAADRAKGEEEIKGLREVLAEIALTQSSNEEEIKRLKGALAEASSGPSLEEVTKLTHDLSTVRSELDSARNQIAEHDTQTQMSRIDVSELSTDIKAIAKIAVELRQPLSSVMGYTDLLLSESVGLLGAAQRQFLERVRSGTDRMGALLSNLIQIAAIETGMLSLRPGPVDLVSCIESAVTQASLELRKRHLALRMDFPEDMPPITGDIDATTHIVMNLLNNAIGASPDGEEIIVSARVQEGEQAEFLMLTVSDAGEGIPAGDLGRVFQRTQEAGDSPIPGLGDQGIGLSVVQSLIDTMGGRVWLDSKVGLGSTFTVLFPLARPSPETLLSAE
jgi:signal transduction histidine kinase